MKNKTIAPGIVLGLALAGLAIPAYSQPALYLPFEGNFNDASGNNNHGTPGTDEGGVAEIVNDPVRGNVLHLNGEGKVEVPISPSLDIVGPITMAAWIKIAGVSASQHNIINHGHNNADTQFGNATAEVTLRINAQTTYQAGTFLGGGLRPEGNQQVSYDIPTGDIGGDWIHIAATATPDGLGTYTWDLYRNGIAVATQGGWDGALQMSAINWAVGARGGQSDVQRGFNGYIDDVLIYNQALSPEQVLALVPEPASGALLGLGTLIFIGSRRLRRIG